MVWFKWLIFITFSGQFMVSLFHLNDLHLWNPGSSRNVGAAVDLLQSGKTRVDGRTKRWKKRKYIKCVNNGVKLRDHIKDQRYWYCMNIKIKRPRSSISHIPQIDKLKPIRNLACLHTLYMSHNLVHLQKEFWRSCW